MKRKCTLFTAIFVTSILIVIQAIEIVDANPFEYFKGTDPVTGTIPPIITIITPQNNTKYSSENITASFYVCKPKLDSS